MNSSPDHYDMAFGTTAHTLAKALDYVGIDDYSHGRRVGLMSYRIAQALLWDRPAQMFMLVAGMLHDIGVSSTSHHQKLVDEIEWEGAELHCLRGEDFLRSFAPFAPYAPAIRHHHTRWNRMPESVPRLVAEQANMIYLADRLDVFYLRFLADHPHHATLLHKRDILDNLHQAAPELFATHLWDALYDAGSKDRFWLELQEDFLDEAITEAIGSDDRVLHLDWNGLRDLGVLISRIVDAKSPFTHYHSLRVADLTDAVGGLLGFSTARRHLLRIAGLLHDVGKLRTPDAILEKHGSLDGDEFAQMRAHPMNSKRILAALFPGSPMIDWVVHHHEKLDGSGYPDGCDKDALPVESRILAVCDIFQALSQDRPYRGRLPVEQVLAIMQPMVDGGSLDPDIFALVCQHPAHLYAISTQEDTQK